MTPPRKATTEVGGYCGCLFFGVFFGAGLLFLYLFVAKLIVPEWRANHVFVERPCIVLDKRMRESDGENGTVYRPDIRIRYEVDDQTHVLWTYDAAGMASGSRARCKEVLAQFVVGRSYPCWYDPDDPGRAVLVRGYSGWMYLAILIPLVFVVVGAGGMYYAWTRRGRSPEELAVCDRPTAAGAVDFPAVPAPTDQPGDVLAHRLSLKISQKALLIGILIGGLFWNGIVAVFVTMAVRGHLRGRPDWCLTVFLTPFVAVGLGIVYYFGKQLLITFGVPRAQVELADYPLHTGQTTRLLVRQGGGMHLHRLELLLLCEESASYTEGTNTRTETKIVYRAVLAEAENLTLGRGAPWEFDGTLQAPAGMMHSFAAAKNKVEWKLLVKGDVARWPNFEWDYPLVIRPAKGGEA